MVDPGEGPGGLRPPPYFYTSEARRAGKCFFETGPPISASSPPLSEGLDPLLRTIRMRLRVYLPPKQARATNCGRDDENKICPPKQWYLTPPPPPIPLFHPPEFISLILIYLDFRGGRERESRTYCGKRQANLGFASASQTFNEKSFSRRVFLVKR